MLKYIRDYCDHAKVNDLIHCHKNVESVKYCDESGTFFVDTLDLDTEEKFLEKFDYDAVF